MKKILSLLLALAFLGCAQVAHAAAAIVQSSGKQSVTASAGNPTFTISGVVAGDAIVVLVNYLDQSNNSIFPTSISDPGGSYTADEQIKAGNINGSHTSAAVYSFFNAASGSHLITFTRGAGATSVNWIYDILEVSGLPLTNSKDASSTTSYGFGNTGPVNIGGSTLGAASGLSVVLSVVETANTPLSFCPPEIGMSGSGSSYMSLFGGSTDWPSGCAGYLIPGTTSALGADFGGIGMSTNWGAVSVYYTPAPTSSSSQFFFGAMLLPAHRYPWGHG